VHLELGAEVLQSAIAERFPVGKKYTIKNPYVKPTTDQTSSGNFGEHI